jgi:hypothetical protein
MVLCEGLVTESLASLASLFIDLFRTYLMVIGEFHVQNKCSSL